MVAPYIYSETCTIGIQHYSDYGKIVAYYYIDDYFYYSEKKYLYTVKAGYYISTGEVECETEPATYSSICKSYTPSLRESGITVKESFELLINKLGMEMDDLKEASTND